MLFRSGDMMGCTNIWYKACLEYFVWILSNEQGVDNIKKMSIKALEVYIEESRLGKSEREFYYEAGMASLYATLEANKTSCDDLNAAICAVAEFEDFIELVPEMV